MKKVIALFLAALMLVCIFGCTPSKPEETTEGDSSVDYTPVCPDYVEGKYNVGYSIVDITPEYSVPMGGYGTTENRYAYSVKHRLYFTTLAITDVTGKTIIIMGMDTQSTSTMDKNKPLLSQVFDIPQEYIYTNATHTHSAAASSNAAPGSLAHKELYPTYMLQAVKAALEDRKPVTGMSVGSIEAEGINFIRHYRYTNPDGTYGYFGDNFGTAVYDETTVHMVESDPTMHLLKIEREGEKDIVVMNFRGHPHTDGGGSATVLSSDVVGGCRTALQINAGVDFLYLQGASGNCNMKSKIASEMVSNDTSVIGRHLADYAIECMNDMTPVEYGVIKTNEYTWDGPIDHSMDSMIGAAAIVQGVWKTSGNNYTETVKAGKPYGIRSPYHASAIKEKASSGTHMPYRICGIELAKDVALITNPSELYSTLGQQVEDASPYTTTMVLGYTNGYTSYIPDAFAFEVTTYETDVCRYAPGCGEIIRDHLINTLNELYNMD